MSSSTRPTSTATSSGGAGYDERFVVPLEASRRGAHRAGVSPVMAVLPVAAVVGVVIGAIALVYLFLGGMNTTDSGSDATTAAGPSSAPASTASAAGPTASASGSATATDSMTATSAVGTVDRTLPVAVYNGTSPTISGLAKKAAGRLGGAGWRLGTVATWNGAPVGITTVYYGATDQRATALAVVKSLGHGVAKISSSKAGAGITVVVGNDYPGGGGGLAQPRATSTGVRLATSTPTVTAGGRIATTPGHAATTSASRTVATRAAVTHTAATHTSVSPVNTTSPSN